MQTSIFFNIAAMSVISFSFAYFTVQYDSHSVSGKYFRLLMVAIFGAAAFDSLSVHLLQIADRLPASIIHISYITYLIFVILCAYFNVMYTRTLVYDAKSYKITDLINHLIMVCHILICLISPFTGLYYSFSADMEFVQGPLYIFIYLISGYYLVFSFVLMMKYRDTTKRRFYSIIAFITLTFSGAVCQFLFFKVMAIYFIYAIAALILLFAFETPDYQKLTRRTIELKESQKLLELARAREEELSRTVNELTKTATWVIYFDANGEFGESKWSPEFFSMLGYAQDEIPENVETVWLDSLHPDDKEAAMAAFMAGLKGAEYKHDTRLVCKDGSYKWFACSGAVKYDEGGRILSYQGIIQDVDDEKYRERLIEERLEAVKQLEDSQTELRRALFRAEEASNAKTTFLSNMSHDIRTPMNAIVGFTELALNHLDDEKEVKECLTTIKSSGQHLLSLINDVLDMSRIESGKVVLEKSPISITEVVQNIGNMTSANADEKNQKFEIHCDNIEHDFVNGDRLRINQILINCIGNAIKYTQENGEISVSVEELPCDREGYGNYEFRIKDNGMGMTPEFLRRVFEPFERARSSTYSKIQGTGLGMAITKNFVEMMDGTIRAESEVGKGSEFIILLPMEIVSAEEWKAENSRDNGTVEISFENKIEALQGKHFLVVDDNNLNRRIVKRILGEKGMIIDECDSGASAVEYIKNANPDELDMVFMDIQMPGMNGYETADVIRGLKDTGLSSVPMIAMTANAFEEDKKLAIQHGMHGHVAKPFKLEELINVLYALLCREV